MEKNFTLEVQMAGYKHEQVDKKGAIDYASFVQEFEQFPWQEQLAYTNNGGSGCSATLSVINHKEKLKLWVSILGDEEDTQFILGYMYPKEIKRFFGLLSPKLGEWLEMYFVEDKEDVKKLFDLFFEARIDKLENEIRKFELLDELES